MAPGEEMTGNELMSETADIGHSVVVEERRSDCKAVVIYSTFLSLLFVSSTSLAALIAIKGRKERKTSTLSINSWLHAPARP